MTHIRLHHRQLLFCLSVPARGSWIKNAQLPCYSNSVTAPLTAKLMVPGCLVNSSQCRVMPVACQKGRSIYFHFRTLLRWHCGTVVACMDTCRSTVIPQTELGDLSGTYYMYHCPKFNSGCPRYHDTRFTQGILETQLLIWQVSEFSEFGVTIIDSNLCIRNTTIDSCLVVCISAICVALLWGTHNWPSY